MSNSPNLSVTPASMRPTKSAQSVRRPSVDPPSDLETRRPTVASVRGHVKSKYLISVASTLVSEPKAGYPGRILALPRFRFQKVTKTPLSFSDSDDRLDI